MKDRLYLISVLAGATVLTIIGREELPSETRLAILATFGATTALGVLAVSLYRVNLELQHSRRELQQRQAEIHFAREVQAALFPRDFPRDRGLSFSAVCLPVQGIGGDYYDVVPSRDQRVLFAVADISGKGISAAILMANLQARLRTLWEATDSLSEVCRRLNDHVFRVTEPSRYATLFIALWNPLPRRLQYVNAGHQPPILVGSAAECSFTHGGLPLGLFPEAEYETSEIDLHDRDLLVLFSDGVTEAINRQGEEFEAHRLEEVIRRHRDRPLDELKEHVIEALNAWNDGKHLDDVTLLLAEVDAENTQGER